MKGILGLLFVLNCMLLCFAGYNSYAQQETHPTSSSSSGWSDYAYSITDGNCKGRKLVQEDVILEGQEYTVRKRTYSWLSRGMYKISCIRVTNNMIRNADAGQTRIAEGGVGDDHVKIELTSRNSRGVDFTVEIWGEETNVNAGIAVIASTPSREMYIGGQKYCRCN